MSDVSWNFAWESNPGRLRSVTALARREEWIRLVLLSGVHTANSMEGYKVYGYERTKWNDEPDELMVWVFIFGLMALLYSLSRCMARPYRRQAGEIGRRAAVGIVPPRIIREAEPNVGLLNRLETICPAKPYSIILENFLANGEWYDGCTIDDNNNNVDLEKDGIAKYFESGCAICFEEFQTNTLVRVLPCKHLYHRQCLDTWFQRSMLCPLCMRDYANYNISTPQILLPHISSLSISIDGRHAESNPIGEDMGEDINSGNVSNSLNNHTNGSINNNIEGRQILVPQHWLHFLSRWRR